MNKEQTKPKPETVEPPSDCRSGSILCSPALPRVLLNHSQAHRLNEKHPNRIGLMIGPSRLRPTRGLPVACDNDRYSVWSKGKEWDEAAFWKMLDTVQATDDPIWVVVPDVVGDACETFREWDAWAERLRNRRLTLALAVQDGMTPDAVRRNSDPDVIFVGGTTGWKRRTLWNWCREFDRTHCGRVNYERWLWDAHRSGAESTDGTGWFRGDQKQLRGLLRYLMRSDAGMGPAQLELEFARTFGGTVPKTSYVS